MYEYYDLWFHAEVKNIVTGLSILVGFTWETTMDGCTAS